MTDGRARVNRVLCRILGHRWLYLGTWLVVDECLRCGKAAR